MNLYFTEQDRVRSQQRALVRQAIVDYKIELQDTLPVNLTFGERLNYGKGNNGLKEIFKAIRWLRKPKNKTLTKGVTITLRNGMNVDLNISKPYWCRVTLDGGVSRVYKSNKNKKFVTLKDVFRDGKSDALPKIRKIFGDLGLPLLALKDVLK